MSNEAWLNGWTRIGATVLVGTRVRRAGCGRIGGTVCVVFPIDWEPPGPLPDWPFDKDNCPLCRGEYIEINTAEELERLDWKTLREAMTIKKRRKALRLQGL